MTAMLEGVRVLDLTDEMGFVCGKILAELGAEVIKVERPGGDPARKLPPFRGDEPGIENSLYWRSFNAGKRSIVLDLDTPEGADAFRALARTSQIIVEGSDPRALERRGLAVADLRAENPALIGASVTPFGRTGPYSEYIASELTVIAMSGVLNNTGDPDLPPVKEALDSGYFHAGVAAALGVMLAYFEADTSHTGQDVDVSVQEVAASRMTSAIVAWSEGVALSREGHKSQLGPTATDWFWPCKDGHLFWHMLGGAFGATANKALSDWIGEYHPVHALQEIDDWMSFDKAGITQEEWGRFADVIGPFFLRFTREEVRRESLARGLNATVANEPGDVHACEHLRSREYWSRVEDPALGRIDIPRYFFKASVSTTGITTPAPTLGADTEEILAGLGGAPRDTVAAAPCDAPTTPALAGIRVLDFGWALVGSITGKLLGDHGAEVIRVESSKRPDMTRVDRRFSRSTRTSFDDKPWFAHFNTSKKSLSIDLKNPKSRRVIEGLIRQADVINENFTPGTLAALGYGYEDVKKINPDVIYISGSLFGQTGPLANEWGIDGTGAAISGRLHLTGWPDRTPITPSAGIYGDYIVPLVNAIGVVGALLHRRRTGQGQYLEASMYEVTAQQIMPATLDFEVNGREQSRTGNRVTDAAPHGVYPCAGEDRWSAIAVFGDEEWSRFAAAIGAPAWTTDPAFATHEDRKHNEDRLDDLVAEWTREREPHEVMTLLQAARVRAGAVQTPHDFIDADPQLTHRGVLAEVPHSVLGAFPHQVPPFRLSRTVAEVTAAPMMGEHNEQIVTGDLGFSEVEFIDLLLEGALQ
ncbi:CaiB/BaiF CoA transferase family protein [Microbacterium sp. A196]|uniref:CaiB/BaiF CoA transferase family protein n=1 Tax=unclassified Microbacterium TaxID=2609290 RepID=UPI003F2D77C2